MISEDDKFLIEEAHNCHDCISWHKHCHAECCKLIFLNISLERFEKSTRFINIKPIHKLTLDEVRYYNMRGIEYIRGVLRHRKSRVSNFGSKFVYIYPCSHLKDNLCDLHNSELKPDICCVLSNNLVQSGKLDHGGSSNIIVTDNCLFKYK